MDMREAASAGEDRLLGTAAPPPTPGDSESSGLGEAQDSAIPAWSFDTKTTL